MAGASETEQEGSMAARGHRVKFSGGPDGKPVIGVDGRIVMVDAEGRPIHTAEGSLNGMDGK